MNSPRLTWDDFVSWWKCSFKQDIPVADLASWRLLVESNGVELVRSYIDPGKRMPSLRKIRRALKSTDAKTRSRSMDNADLACDKLTPEQQADIDAKWDECRDALQVIQTNAELWNQFWQYLLAKPFGSYYVKAWDEGRGAENHFILAAAGAWYRSINS